MIFFQQFDHVIVIVVNSHVGRHCEGNFARSRMLLERNVGEKSQLQTLGTHFFFEAFFSKKLVSNVFF